MKLFKSIIVITIVLIVNACGGGGGTTTPVDSNAGANTNTNTNTGVGAIGLRANFSNAAYITLTNSSTSSAATKTSFLNIKNKWLKGILELFVPTAFASTVPFNNVIAFDANGKAIENPLVTDVNVFIGAITLDPTGTFVYLGIENHQNYNMFSDYRSLPGNKCTLYRVNKISGEVKCITDTSKYDLYNPSTNYQMLGNTSESFIKFDINGNGYLIMFAQQAAYGSGGTEKQRLIKIEASGNASIVRDTTAGYARGLTYAKGGKLFYSEDAWFSISGGQTATYVFDPLEAKFTKISASTSGATVVADLSGEIYINTGNNLYWLDQSSWQTNLIYSGGDPIVSLLRSPDGKILSLHYSGNIYSNSPSNRNLIAAIGTMPNRKSKNDISDLFYPPLATNGEYALSIGSDAYGVGQYCATRINDKKTRCAVPADKTPIYLSLAIVGGKGIVFYDTGIQNNMISFELSSFIDGVGVDPVATVSSAGDGSMVAAISMRPPISFVADLANVTTTTADSLLSISNPVSDSYTYLSFTSASNIAGIDATELGLKDSTGVAVDASFRIIDKAIYAAIKDATGKKSSGFQTLGSSNNYSLVFPSTYTVPDTYTSLTFTSASNIAGITDTDLGLKDSAGTSVDAIFKIVDNVISVTVKDTSNIKPSGFKLLGSVNDYSLVFPSSYTPPAVTKGISTKSGNFSVNQSSFAKGIGTKSGFFPVVQPSSILYLDFSAPVVNLDLSGLQLTDSTGAAVPSTISMAKEGMRLEIRVKDTNPSNLTGYKAMPTGSVYKLTLPSRVRLPGQTFLSPFDKTQIVFTTKS